jgi:hypothetical protein
MSGGGDAIGMLRAILAGQPYPPEGVADTPANKDLWAAICADIENMPGGVLPDIPADWTTMPDLPPQKKVT